MNLLTELTRTAHDPAVIAQVRALLEQAERAKQLLAQNDAKLAQHDARLKEKDFKITALTLELAYYRRIRFGSKSEAFSGEQRELFEETVDADLAAILAELEPPDSAPDGAAPKRKRSGAGRQPLPAELPRIEHRHEPASCQCDACGKALVLIGEDISEQLDVEPARFFVHRHIRPQYACRACEHVTAAPVPIPITWKATRTRCCSASIRAPTASNRAITGPSRRKRCASKTMWRPMTCSSTSST